VGERGQVTLVRSREMPGAVGRGIARGKIEREQERERERVRQREQEVQQERERYMCGKMRELLRAPPAAVTFKRK
jgi:hypothetical protein